MEGGEKVEVWSQLFLLETCTVGFPGISLQGEYVSCMIVLCLIHASCRCSDVDIRALRGHALFPEDLRMAFALLKLFPLWRWMLQREPCLAAVCQRSWRAARASWPCSEQQAWLLWAQWEACHPGCSLPAPGAVILLWMKERPLSSPLRFATWVHCGNWWPLSLPIPCCRGEVMDSLHPAHVHRGKHPRFVCVWGRCLSTNQNCSSTQSCLEGGWGHWVDCGRSRLCSPRASAYVRVWLSRYACTNSAPGMLSLREQ